jgi:hypothetical protein
MATYNGSNGDDSFTGASADDQFNAGEGNNTINAGDGNNSVNAGSGNDTVTAGGGNDIINVGEGVNSVDAGGGNNTVNAGAGKDTITTGSGDDQINAGEGDNTINAGDGRNRINTGSGADIIQTGTGNDEINAGEGNNAISDSGGMNRVNTGSGADQIMMGDGNDEINAGEGQNTIDGGGGNNRINTGSGADKITTGSGNDTIYSGAGADIINVSGGSDLVYMGDGTDVIRHVISDNIGSTDDYWGESGTDTLQLVLTAEQAKDSAILADIDAFKASMANGSWLYQFKSLNLTARQFEKLELVAPVEAHNDSATTDEDSSPITINVLSNDVDLLAANNSALHITGFDDSGIPEGASLVLNNDGTFSFDPGTAFQSLSDGENATVTFTYTVADDQGFTDTATATTIVTGNNDAPEAAAVTATGDEDASTPIAITLKGSDIDNGDAVTSFKIDTLPANGVLYTDAAMAHAYVAGTEIAATNEQATLYFKPAADYNGTVTFNYTGNDGDLDSAPASATITVNPMDEPATNNVMDFEGLDSLYYSGTPFYVSMPEYREASSGHNGYAEEGLQVYATSGHYHPVKNMNDGNVAIYGHWGGTDLIRISKTNGSLFSLEELDVLALNGQSTLFGSNGQQITINSTGHLDLNDQFDNVQWVDLQNFNYNSATVIDNLLWA